MLTQHFVRVVDTHLDPLQRRSSSHLECVDSVVFWAGKSDDGFGSDIELCCGGGWDMHDVTRETPVGTIVELNDIVYLK